MANRKGVVEWSDTLRNRLLELRKEGKTLSRITQLTGVPPSTQNDFYDRRGILHQQFWEEYDSLTDEMLEQSNGEVTDTVSDRFIPYQNDLITKLTSRVRRLTKTNIELTKQLNCTISDNSLFTVVESQLGEVAKRLVTVANQYRTNNTNTALCTYEILFSDWQVGKVTENYNTSVAIQKLEYFGYKLAEKLNKDIEEGYKPEKIILACLGDNVEDHLKHGVNSTLATDTTLGEQIALSVRYIYEYVLARLWSICPNIEVVGVAGNHGSSNHKGMDTFKAGRVGYDYTIYKGLEHLCQVAGMEGVHFNIPEGIYAHTQIYDCTAAYEHGYFSKSTESSLEERRSRLSNLLGKYVNYIRTGDKHHLSLYDNGKIVSNSAFFGDDTGGSDYSGTLGFSSIPGQLMMRHRPEGDKGRNTVDDIYFIQLGGKWD